MRDEKQPSHHPYMNWREIEMDVNVTGKTKIRITYFEEEKFPREVSFEGGKIAFEFPIKKEEGKE